MGFKDNAMYFIIYLERVHYKIRVVGSIKNMKKKRIGELLVKAAIITPNELEKALQLQKNSGEKIGEIILRKGWAPEQEVIKLLGFQLGFPYVDLTRYVIDLEAAGLISEILAKRYNLIPLSIKNNTLEVAMSDPIHMVALDDLRLMTQMDITPMIATPTDIKDAISRVYSPVKTKKMTKEFKEQWQIQKPPINTAEDETLYDVTNSPVVKFVGRILDEGIAKGASDIHIEPLEKHIRIRLRVDGQMSQLLETDKEMIDAITTRIKILSNLDIAEKRLPQDGRIQIIKDGQEIDLRVSILPTIYGEKTVIRILYHRGMQFNIRQLGLYPDDEEKVKRMLKAPNGIILVTGPTGSGKSTTLATFLREINAPNINIVTVEDPVENIVEGTSQVAVNVKSGLTFAKALRSILRQDPDVIMVGEMRDLETSEIAIRSAITGHLVLSTLHTNDAVSSVTRLTDMGCQPYMIGSSVGGVIAQRLIRKICLNCKQAYEITQKEHKLTQIAPGTVIYRGKGCQSCNQTGYQGRLGVYEVLITDSDLQEIISKNQLTSQELKEEAIKKGMRTLRDNARWNVIRGYTTTDEMVRITYEQ